MKYLIYSLTLFTLAAYGTELGPVGEGQTGAADEIEQGAALESPADEEPVFASGNPGPIFLDNPAPALPPSDSPAIATSSAVATSTEVSGALPETPVAEIPAYGPTADEGYGSVGLKNQGGILELGRDAEVIPREAVKESGDRKTSSTDGPEEFSL